MSCRSKNKPRLPAPPPPVRSARNVLPGNVWRLIASKTNTPTRAAVARALYGIVPRNRPPVLDRSTKMRYTMKKGGHYKMTWLNKMNPAAYKNREWTYYIPHSKNDIYFFNTHNGPAFTINKNTGRRHPTNVNTANMIKKIPRRLPANTWNGYLRRFKAGLSYAKGAPVREAKNAAIGNKVNRYLAGNENALTNVSIPDLMFWAKGSNWMRANSSYTYRGGQWYTTAGNRLTKAFILRNIKNSSMYR